MAKEKPVARWSELELFLESIPRYYSQCVKKTTQRKPPTQDMTFGSIVDCILFMPEDLEKRFYFMPKADGRTKDGKAAKADAANAVAGKSHKGMAMEIFPVEELERAQGVVDAIRNNADASRLLLHKHVQHDFAFEFDIEGYPCTGHTDAFYPNEWIADLKCPGELPGRYDYGRKVCDWGYHRQAGMYQMGAIHDKRITTPANHFLPFFHVVASAYSPHEIAIFQFDSELCEKGREQMRHLIAELAECVRKNDWKSRWIREGRAVAKLPGYINRNAPFG